MGGKPDVRVRRVCDEPAPEGGTRVLVPGNGRRGPASASGSEGQGPGAMQTLRHRVCRAKAVAVLAT